MALKLRGKVPPPPGCPMSACMSLLGGVWTPEIIWNLSGGARRFSELRRAMPAISAKVLSGRLKDLGGRGVLSRSVLPTTPPSVEYGLTDLGSELVPAIRAIVAVGSRLHLRMNAAAADPTADDGGTDPPGPDRPALDPPSPDRTGGQPGSAVAISASTAAGSST